MKKYKTKPETKICFIAKCPFMDRYAPVRHIIHKFICLFLYLLTFLLPCFSLSLRLSVEQIELITINNLQLIQYNPTIIGSPSAHSTLSQCKLYLTNLTKQIQTISKYKYKQKFKYNYTTIEIKYNPTIIKSTSAHSTESHV